LPEIKDSAAFWAKKGSAWVRAPSSNFPGGAIFVNAALWIAGVGEDAAEGVR